MAIDEKRLKRIGIVDDVEILGIMPKGYSPPGVMFRYPRTGEAFVFSVKAASLIAWHINIFLQEIGQRPKT
jgi:hypothetical protein